MVSSRESTCRVAIIGGGIAGLTAALALQRAGHKTIVLERVPKFQPLGGAIHLPPNACRALRSLGMLPALEREAFEEPHITLMSYARGAILKRSDLVPDMRLKYGAPYLSVGRATLHSSILDAALTAGSVVEYDCVIQSIDFNAPAVHLSNGRVIAADLVVGADGENSQCRDLLLGRPDPPLHFGHKVFSCQISLADLRADTDLADLAGDPGTCWWMGPGSMVITTIPGGAAQHTLNLMGGLPESESTPVQSHPIPATKREIKEVFRSWDARVAKLIDLSSGCVKWTSTATPLLKDWSHSCGRFVLLGDAAHAMTPYLAQGAAQGIEDAVILGALLSHASDCRDIIPALRIFKELREPRCQLLKEVSLKLRDVYCMPDGPCQQQRDHDLLYTEPGPGFMIPWLDPDFQRQMYSYDAAEVAKQAWLEDKTKQQ